MIGKCPACGKIVTLYTWRYMNRDLSSATAAEYEHACKHCGARLEWSVPEEKAKKAKWLLPVALLSAIPLAFLPNGVGLGLFVLGTGGFATYLMLNPPALRNKS